MKNLDTAEKKNPHSEIFSFTCTRKALKESEIDKMERIWTRNVQLQLQLLLQLTGYLFSAMQDT